VGLADTLGETPLRLDREERQEVVAMLSGEGLSSRAIAPIVRATQRTVVRDVATAAETNVSPDPVTIAPVIGLDGKAYQRPEAPQPPRRKPLTDTAKDIGWEARNAAEKLTRITGDDRWCRRGRARRPEPSTGARAHQHR
jgi:hypothetical protein